MSESKPILQLGDVFDARTGPRKVYQVGDQAYFVRNHRMYKGEIVERTDESYRDCRGNRQVRCRLKVRVIGV